MDLWPDCIPCIMRMCLEVAHEAWRDERRTQALMEDVLSLEVLRGEDWEVTPPEVIRDVWLKIIDVCGRPDPLRGMKVKQNRKILHRYASCKELVYASHQPLVEATKLAVAGNSMDSMGYAEELAVDRITEWLAGVAVQGEAVDALRSRLGKARKLAYLGDNCGEIVFDKLLIEVIKETYDPEVIFVARSVPILNDATRREALEVGLDRVAHVMENGIREPLPGTMLEKVSSEVRGVLQEADLIIAKGGGNHDTLTEEDQLRGKITYLVQAKCHPYCTIHKSALGALVVYNT
jgi:uncharacterized protein with ATP-grasp and redox domains